MDLDLPPEGEAFPEHLIDYIWKQLHASDGTWELAWADGQQSLTKPLLKTLVDNTFQASLHTEEGRAVRFRLLYARDDKQATIRFTPPLSFSARELVKLAPTVGLGFRSIVVCPPKTGELQIVGINDPDLSPNNPSMSRNWGHGVSIYTSQTVGMMLTALDPGHIRVTTSEYRTCELRRGSIVFPQSPDRISEVGDWFTEAAEQLTRERSKLALKALKTLEEANTRYTEHAIVRTATCLVRRTWNSILRKVSSSRHGGCFLIVPNDYRRTSARLRFKYLLTSKYRLTSNTLREALKARTDAEPQLSHHEHGQHDVDFHIVDSAHFLERDLSRVSDLVASLAAVDGAVVLRRNLGVVGFGAEILNNETPRDDQKINMRRHPNLHPPSHDPRSLVAFGMRHRSAFRFCERMNGSLAFVISQDGDVRVFVNTGRGTVEGVDSVPEDWIMS